jgi:hypothetical protein
LAVGGLSLYAPTTPSPHADTHHSLKRASEREEQSRGSTNLQNETEEERQTLSHLHPHFPVSLFLSRRECMGFDLDGL